MCIFKTLIFFVGDGDVIVTEEPEDTDEPSEETLINETTAETLNEPQNTDDKLKIDADTGNVSLITEGGSCCSSLPYLTKFFMFLPKKNIYAGMNTISFKILIKQFF